MFCTGTIQRVSNASPSEIMRQRLAVMGSLCDIGRCDANAARRSGLLVRAVLFFRWRALYADDLRLALVVANGRGGALRRLGFRHPGLDAADTRKVCGDDITRRERKLAHE